MRDIELYRASRELTVPWTVAGVDVDMTGQREGAGPGPYPCPECGTAGPRYDSKPHRWRHLDTRSHFKTTIKPRQPARNPIKPGCLTPATPRAVVLK